LIVAVPISVSRANKAVHENATAMRWINRAERIGAASMQQSRGALLPLSYRSRIYRTLMGEEKHIEPSNKS
jgi:hypothetical protein